MLNIWGRANSINVQKVLWCCAELDVPFHRTDLGGPFGGNREAEYLKLNPNGLVPTVSDGDLVLWESNAIVRYVAARYGAGILCPEDFAERAAADKWMDWQLGTLWADFRPAFIGLVRTPREERDPAAIGASLEETSRDWAMLDAHLASREYVTGPTLSMADIPLGATIHRWFSLDLEREPMPNVEAWYARLRERPAYAAYVDLPLS